MGNLQKINRKLRKFARQTGGQFFVRKDRAHLVLEGESGDWQAIVHAGYIAAKGGKRCKGCLVNDVRYTGEAPPPTRLPQLRDDAL
ncbi:MAG: hypothetical protein LBB50_05400, partial [Oscillospiraceae bacterium]|nr:hypothetical protein [Oscillospiraceae bacterium]